MTKQLIAFLHGKFIVSLPTPEVPSGERFLALSGLTKELSRYGYVVSDEALVRLSVEDAKEIYKDVIPYLIELYHHGEGFSCLYPGFPQEVLKMPEQFLKTYQTAIYDGLIDIDDFIKNSPWYSQKDREEATQNVVSGSTLQSIGFMTEEDFMRIPHSIMSAGMSLAEQTRDELVWFLENYPDLEIPETIPFKETMCIVASHRPDYKIKEINDVLRYAMYLMGGSPALEIIPKRIKEHTWSRKKIINPEWRKLSTLSRKKRKEILAKIESVIDSKSLHLTIVDAKRFYGHWVLLSERIHSGDYKNLYPKALEFFHTLQTRILAKDHRTWYSEVQEMYDSGKDILEITKKLSTRPGELVRRLDSILRRTHKNMEKTEEVLDVFLETDGMKNKTLLELLSYYDRRTSSGVPRLVSKKGSSMKKAIPALEAIEPEFVEFVQTVIVRKIFANMKAKGFPQDLTGKTVFLDPDLKRIPIPTDMRSRTDIIPAGTKVPIEGDIIRFYIHWKQTTCNEDLDLHAKVLDSSCKTKLQIGFNYLHNAANGSIVFSGDVLNRPGDCAEYIDIDLNKLQGIGEDYRYVVMIANNWKDRGFDTLLCWLGYSEVPNVEEGNEQWIPENVRYCQPINSKCSAIAAMLVDIKEKTVMFLDIDINSVPGRFFNQQESIAKYYTTEHSFTTFDVMKQYYLLRGANVEESSIEDKENTTVVKASEIVKDYTTVLDILGD